MHNLNILYKICINLSKYQKGARQWGVTQVESQHLNYLSDCF